MSDWTKEEAQYLYESWTDGWPKTLPVPCPNCPDDDAFADVSVRKEEVVSLKFAEDPGGGQLRIIVSLEDLDGRTNTDEETVKAVEVACQCSREGGCGRVGYIQVS